MNGHWGKLNLRLAWKDFPSGGTHSKTNGGGTRIIDADYYKGMSSEGSYLLAWDDSSDHRAYKTVYDLPKVRTGSAPQLDPYVPGSGDIKDGEPWWGFGDYDDDEIYHLDVAPDSEEQP